MKSDFIEFALAWYTYDPGARKAKDLAEIGRLSYLGTRIFIPYLVSTIFITTVVHLWRPFAWVLVVLLGLGFAGFAVAAFVAIGITIYGGDGDSLGCRIAATVFVVGAVLAVLGFVAFSSVVFSFGVLRMDTPPGW